jgi:ParB family chromosome partitioning protein
MSLKDLKKKSASALDAIDEKTPSPITTARAVTAPGATAMMQPTIDALNERAKQAESKSLEAERSLAEMQSRLSECPQVLPLSELVEIEGRRRKLTPEQFEELRANLAHNALVQPISVRKLADGRYEVVSGYNRLAVYRALGRFSIPVSVVDIEDSETERSAFFANLLQPSLPDYERYLGFKKWHDQTGDTQAVMAEKAGIAKSQLSKLFSFAELPPAAIDLVADNPASMGMQCASDLARLAASGKSDRVTEAVRQLVDGQFSQKDAVRYAAASDPKIRVKAESIVVKVRAGRLEYCRYIATGGILKIEFKDPQERLDAEEAIAKLLQELAIKAKDS